MHDGRVHIINDLGKAILWLAVAYVRSVQPHLMVRDQKPYDPGRWA